MADNQPKSLIDTFKNAFSNPSIVKGALLIPYNENTVQSTDKEKNTKDENKNLLKKLFGL